MHLGLAGVDALSDLMAAGHELRISLDLDDQNAFDFHIVENPGFADAEPILSRSRLSQSFDSRLAYHSRVHTQHFFNLIEHSGAVGRFQFLELLDGLDRATDFVSHSATCLWYLVRTIRTKFGYRLEVIDQESPTVMLRPHTPIQRPVPHRLGDVLGLDVVVALKVGDRPCYAENLVVGTRREAEILHRGFQKRHGLRFERAELPHLPGCHPAVDLRSFGSESLRLAAPSLETWARRSAEVGRGHLGQLRERNRRYLDMQVDPVEQGARNPAQVLFDLWRRTATSPPGIAAIPAGAGIHGGNQDEFRREGRAPQARLIVTRPSSSGCLSTSSVLRLNSGISSRNSTPLCARLISPGWGVVPPPTRPASLTEWWGERNGRIAISGFSGSQQAHSAIDPGCLQALRRRQRRQDRRQPLGEQGFAGARRTDHQDIVAPRRGDQDRSLGVILSLDVHKVFLGVRELTEDFFEIDRRGSISTWPERKPTASARLPTGKTFRPSTTAASAALADGTSRPSCFSSTA